MINTFAKQSHYPSIGRMLYSQTVKKMNNISSYIDFSKHSTLQTLSSPSCQTPVHQKALFDLIPDLTNRIPRRVKTTTTKHGVVFPVYPEILAYAMKQAENKITVEIGAADGLNSIMLAFGGAKKIYVNDICPGEILEFQKRHSKLPPDIQNKFTAILGDGIDFLDHSFETQEKINLLLCRNVIHFFTEEEKSKLLQTAHKKLESGGVAILSTNTLEESVSPELTDHKTHFILAQILLYPIKKNPNSLPDMYPLAVSEAPKGTKIGFYDRKVVFDAKIGPNQLDVETIRKALPSLENKEVVMTHNVIEQSKGILEKVEIMTSSITAYSRKSLTHLLESHGFVVEHALLTRPDGHLAKADDPKQQVVVIAKKK